MAPVVITLVSDGTRCLLARQSSFPKGMYSALAGFCDIGKDFRACTNGTGRHDSVSSSSNFLCVPVIELGVSSTLFPVMSRKLPGIIIFWYFTGKFSNMQHSWKHYVVKTHTLTTWILSFFYIYFIIYLSIHSFINPSYVLMHRLQMLVHFSLNISAYIILTGIQYLFIGFLFSKSIGVKFANDEAWH